MQFDVGAIVEGEVSKITDFGAFVRLDSGDTGMIHISEIDDSFVKEVSNFLKEGQHVKARVIGSMKNGNPSLSIKQTNTEKTQKKESFKNCNQKTIPKPFKKKFSNFRPTDFEDMMSKFKKTSEEKISEYRKAQSISSSRGKRSKKR